MNKNQKIIEVVHYFLKKYGDNSFFVKDFWDSDLNAIGLIDRSESYLIYISIPPSSNDLYYVALENPSNDPIMPYEPAGDFDNLSLVQVELLFIKHLRIKAES